MAYNLLINLVYIGVITHWSQPFILTSNGTHPSGRIVSGCPLKGCTLKKLSRQEAPNSVKRKKRKQWRVVIPRANHNTHRTTFVISSRTGCCRAAKSTRITTDQNEHVCAVDIMQFTVVIPRTRTNMFVQYISYNLRSWYHGPERTCLYSI